MKPDTSVILHGLERLRDVHGRVAAQERLCLLRALGARALTSANQVRRLHEVLCFCRAYPDNRRVLSAVERELRRFHKRRDLRRFSGGLLNSGIVGTDTVYAFNAWTAEWLAEHWPDRLAIEWASVHDASRVVRMLFVLALPAEAPGLDEAPLPIAQWTFRLAGAETTDAAFVIARAGSLAAPREVRVRLFDELDLPIRLKAGPRGPSRTGARFSRSPLVFQPDTLRRGRPDLVAEALTPPEAIREVGSRDAKELIHLAHEAMVTRERDLDAFAWADDRDVRLIDCGKGLQFACIGVRPEKRFLLESVYGFLTLKNGIPIGYALASGLFESAEVAYNVFATFRGGEAAWVYARFLAVVRALFHCDTFEVPPYQLGDGNDEGLESGAWWFYYKLGLRPWARGIQPVVEREAARVARTQGYLTPVSVLKKLVRQPMFLSLGRRRAEVLGWQRYDRVGLAVSDRVTARFGIARDRAAEVLAAEAASQLLAGDWKRWREGERIAWRQWGPLVAVLPGLSAWPVADRRALATVIRAKGGRRESDFVPLFDGHARLRAAVLALARSTSPERRRPTGRR